MKVVLTLETRFLEHRGVLYSPLLDYTTYWERYLRHFNEVVLCARAQSVEHVPEGYAPSTGPRVSYEVIPYYVGLREYLRNRFRVARQVREVARRYNAFILRLPSPIAALMARQLQALGKKYIAEVAGDPCEVGRFLPLPYLLREPMRHIQAWQLRQIVRHACGVLYVTERYLQSRYPSSPEAFTAAVSDALIPADVIVDPASRLSRLDVVFSQALGSRRLRIGSIGQLYAIKSPVEVVHAVGSCARRGWDLELHFAGTGPLETAVRQAAEQYGIADRVVLHGQVPTGRPIFDFLDSLDLYVQFSKTEGLPRAVVEAMARACPVIGSAVGGIPELLPADMLVRLGDVAGLADRIDTVLKDSDRMRRSICENIARAKDFTAARLEEKRHCFYAQAAAVWRS